MTEVDIAFRLNGRSCRVAVPARTSLADLLRDHLGLTGTHLGCEQGVCGSCTVLLDDRSVRSCIVLAAQVGGRTVTTIEGLTPGDGELSALQRALSEAAGVQCGFCTPGFVVAATELLRREPAPDEASIRTSLSGNLCRCTGYEGIVRAIASQVGSAGQETPRWNTAGPEPGGSGPAAPPLGPSRHEWRASAPPARTGPVPPAAEPVEPPEAAAHQPTPRRRALLWCAAAIIAVGTTAGLRLRLRRRS